MTHLRAGTTLVGALLILLLLPAAALAADAAITEDGIEPDPIVVEEGEPVVFTNETGAVVRLIADNGRWDSGDLGPGDAFSITFDVAGSQTFASEDGAITGTIEVGDVSPDTAQEDEDSTAVDDTAVDDAADDSDAEDADAEAVAEEGEAPAEDAAEEPATPSMLAATGLPSAALAWAAALCTLLGILVLRQTGRR